MKTDQKLHILPFLGSLFRMAQSEFSKNDAKPFIFPKITKKTLFLGYDFFLNLNFHYVPDTEATSNLSETCSRDLYF